MGTVRIREVSVRRGWTVHKATAGAHHWDGLLATLLSRTYTKRSVIDQTHVLIAWSVEDNVTIV